MFNPIPIGHTLWETKCLTVALGNVLRFEAQSKYGTLRFGQDPRDGHIGWRFQHAGGAVTLPYSIGAKLYVGLLPEVRPNLGPGEHLCAIGGFRRPDETYQDAARRETAAETGAIVEPSLLPGVPGAIDRNYFEVNIAAGEGLKAYAISVPMHQMQESDEGCLIHPAWSGKARPVQFWSWRDAILRSPCVIARSAIAQLVAWLPQIG